MQNPITSECRNTRRGLVKVAAATGRITGGTFYDRDDERTRPKRHANPPSIWKQDDRVHRDPFLPESEQN